MLSSALTDSNRNQSRLHEATAAVVIVGIETKPNDQSEDNERQGCEEKVAHGSKVR